MPQRSLDSPMLSKVSFHRSAKELMLCHLEWLREKLWAPRHRATEVHDGGIARHVRASSGNHPVLLLTCGVIASMFGFNLIRVYMVYIPDG